jgi:nucleotide-binding universal stress UspA family protein
MASNEIVVGVDGSDTSVAALRWAFEHAEHSGATVVALHVWEYPFVGDITGTAAMPDQAMLLEGAEALLAQAIEKAGVPASVKVVPEVVEGPSSQRLLERAESAQLLVVGARPRRLPSLPWLRRQPVRQPRGRSRWWWCRASRSELGVPVVVPGGGAPPMTADAGTVRRSRVIGLSTAEAQARLLRMAPTPCPCPGRR